MASAKETLEKIAKAIGIATEKAASTTGEAIDNTVEAIKETVEDVKEAVEETVEDVKEVIEDTVDDVKEVVADVVENVGEVIEEAGESVKEVAESIDPTPQDERVKELESQIDELKSILKEALETKTEDVKVVPEVPADDKGLTHSPEKVVEKKVTKIGKKGGSSIMDNVFKYINN